MNDQLKAFTPPFPYDYSKPNYNYYRYSGMRTHIVESVFWPKLQAWARDNLRGEWRLTHTAPYLEADDTYDQALITLRWAGEAGGAQ